MALSTRLLLLAYGAILAQSQTLLLSACSRIGNERRARASLCIFLLDSLTGKFAQVVP